MVYPCIEGPLAETLRKLCLSTLALLISLAASRCIGSQTMAYASATIVPASPHPGPGASIQSFGNGKSNKNDFLIGTIVNDRSGMQGIRNGNAGGKIISSQAICNRKIHCKLNQRAIISDSW
jgi:hypothetical protein